MANLSLDLSSESTTAITLGNNAVMVVDGRPMASSYEVALTFEKQHKNVLQRIESLECSDKFRELNFQLSEQTQKNGNITKQIPYYRMTFDGFVFLVGSFTGKKAAAFKEAYIARFNWMREELIRRQFEAERPKATKPQKPKAVPNGLTTEQQEAIKGLVKARVDLLPQDKRAGAAVKCWSALKNKFGCTYKKIDPDQFTEAVSLVARIELEGEFLGKDDPSKLTPFAQIIGRPLKPIERWIVYTDGSDKEQYRPIPLDSFVMTPAKLLYVMANTADAPISAQELLDFVVAALSKLKAIRSAKAVPQKLFNEGAKQVAQRFLDEDFGDKKPNPVTLNQLDLAMLYTFSSAAMQLCDMGERLKPAIEALRPMALFGVNARLESCRLAVSHLYKQMGPQMEAAARQEKLFNEWMDLGAAEDRSRPIIRG